MSRTSASLTSRVTVSGCASSFGVRSIFFSLAANAGRVIASARTVAIDFMLPAPDACRRRSVPLLPAPQLVKQREHQARPGRSQGMAEGDGAAVDVQPLRIDSELLDHCEDLPGEGLIDLDQVDVVELQSRFF